MGAQPPAPPPEFAQKFGMFRMSAEDQAGDLAHEIRALRLELARVLDENRQLRAAAAASAGR